MLRKLVKVTKDRPMKDHSYKKDPKKAEKNLKWKPKYTIKEGLKKTVKWYDFNKSEVSRLKKHYVHKP